MTTMIVRIENNFDIKEIAATVRQLKGVTEVRIPSGTEFERISGLPYTYEEHLMDICMAEEDYAIGRTTISEKLKKRITTW